MPQVRSIRWLGRRYTAWNVALLGGCLVAGGYAFFGAGTRGDLFWLSLGVAAVLGAGCFVLDKVMIATFKCPTCGAVLPRTRPPRGKIISVQYECAKCDTVWDTEADEGTRYSDPL